MRVVEVCLGDEEVLRVFVVVFRCFFSSLGVLARVVWCKLLVYVLLFLEAGGDIHNRITYLLARSLLKMIQSSLSSRCVVHVVYQRDVSLGSNVSRLRNFNVFWLWSIPWSCVFLLFVADVPLDYNIILLNTVYTEYLVLYVHD